VICEVVEEKEKEKTVTEKGRHWMLRGFVLGLVCGLVLGFLGGTLTAPRGVIETVPPEDCCSALIGCLSGRAVRPQRLEEP
jgi:hypothetical protein